MTLPNVSSLRFRRILVAYDGSALASKALMVGSDLASAEHAVLALLTVVDVRDAVSNIGGVTSAELAEVMRAEAQLKLSVARHYVDTTHPPFEFLREGRPAEEILEVCEEWEADLIVMGAGVHSSLQRLLFGSTTDRVVSKAPCPVLLVP